MMRICGNCEYNDGIEYTSLPPMMKCTITKEFHRNDHVCELELAPVVRCKDCVHYDYDDCYLDGRGTNENDYCSWAEKRGERKDDGVDS